MSKKLDRKLRAFSLLEISIILLIIAIASGAIVKFNTMYKKAKLTAARSLTQVSPVFNIENVIAWYETSLEESFVAGEVEQDGSKISIWYDLSPENVVKNHAYQSTSDNQPEFYLTAFSKGIPAIRFNGMDSFMVFDGSKLINSSYTIFVVEQRRSGDSNNYFIGGTSTTLNANLALGYASDTSLVHSHYGAGNTISFTVDAYASPIARIHTFLFNQSASGGGKKYWLNGGVATNQASSSQTDPISAFTGAALGRYLTNYFNGDIAEIIVINRNITEKEKQDVEGYLSKKYNVALN